MAENNGSTSGQEIFLTRAEVEEMINEKLGSIKVYVSEADITQAQDNIRAIVEQAEF